MNEPLIVGRYRCGAGNISGSGRLCVHDSCRHRIGNGPQGSNGPGEPLNLAGLKATGTWPGIGEEEVSVTVADITGYNANLGKQTLTITKLGKTATFDVTVAAVPVALADFNGTWENGMSRDWHGYFTISAMLVTAPSSNWRRLNNGDRYHVR